MGYKLIRNLAALVLLAAAGLKAHQLATEPVISAGLLDSRWFLIATIEYELFFGLWLLSAILPKRTWAIALACFGLFACVSLYKAILGNASCGCFGRVSVNPWYTATLDLAIVASFVRWPPTDSSPILSLTVKQLRLRVIAVLLVWFVVGVPAAFALAMYSASTLSDVGAVIGDGQIVVLEPEKWIGKKFPLLNDIDMGEQLATGGWTVVLYHHDCPRCQEVLLKYDRMTEQPSPTPVAFVEVPPYGPANVAAQSLRHRGRIRADREWFVATPLELQLIDGRVSSILTSE